MHSRIVDVLLCFGQPWLQLIFLCLFFMVIGRQVAIQTLLLLACCLILNVALKVTFQIPLSNTLGKVGFAFPSGHEQFATVFYLWIAYQLRSRWILLAVIPIICGVGYGLIVAGYHTLQDVIAGAVTGLLLVLGYAELVKRYAANLVWIMLSLASVLMVYIPLRFLPVPRHALIAYGVICLTVLGIWIFQQKKAFIK